MGKITYTWYPLSLSRNSIVWGPVQMSLPYHIFHDSCKQFFLRSSWCKYHSYLSFISSCHLDRRYHSICVFCDSPFLHCFAFDIHLYWCSYSLFIILPCWRIVCSITLLQFFYSLGDIYIWVAFIWLLFIYVIAMSSGTHVQVCLRYVSKNVIVVVCKIITVFMDSQGFLLNNMILKQFVSLICISLLGFKGD